MWDLFGTYLSTYLLVISTGTLCSFPFESVLVLLRRYLHRMWRSFDFIFYATRVLIHVLFARYLLLQH